MPRADRALAMTEGSYRIRLSGHEVLVANRGKTIAVVGVDSGSWTNRKACVFQQIREGSRAPVDVWTYSLPHRACQSLTQIA
jgi:hypothetical protein